jgi:GntR family transcriptional regulator
MSAGNVVPKGEPVSRPATKHELLRSALLGVIEQDPRRDRVLPSERDLAAEFGVSRMTARMAIEELADQGFVYRVQGRGTFIDRPWVSKSLALTSFTEDMLARGLRPSTRVVLCEERPAGAAASRDLRISPAAPVIYMRRVRLADEIPICLETVQLPAELVPGLADVPVTGSLYDLLASRYRIRITHAEQRIRATVLEPEEAELLDAAPVSPALLVERISNDKAGRPVERARSLYRADRYDFRVAVDRRRPDR